jgi:hypothetical protein
VNEYQPGAPGGWRGGVSRGDPGGVARGMGFRWLWEQLADAARHAVAGARHDGGFRWLWGGRDGGVSPIPLANDSGCGGDSRGRVCGRCVVVPGGGVWAAESVRRSLGGGVWTGRRSLGRRELGHVMPWPLQACWSSVGLSG